MGICCGIRKLTLEKDESRREVKRILKKYEDEIIVLARPADLTVYKTIQVFQFRELLKLSVNYNKHILCYFDDERAEFFAISDGNAYCFCIRLFMQVNALKEL
jgi:hypothetical protein